MIVRSTHRIVAAAALAATALVATSLPAQAVDNQPYDFSNDHSRAQGDVTWHNGSEVYVSGKLNDLCKGDPSGDGHVADLDVTLHFANGTQARHDVARDPGGCDSSPTTFSRGFDPDRRIVRLVLHLCEGADCVTRTKFNPYP